MARTFTPKDCYALINALQKQMTGQTTITAVDSSTFVSAGELILNSSTENILNSLSILVGRTLIASRPYSAKLNMIKAANSGVYTNRLRKISFYSKNALPDGDHNTDLFTNLKEGFTAGQNPDSGGTAQSTKSQYEQHQAVTMQMNFGGTSVWQNAYTVYEDQLQAAFRNEGEFVSFMTGFIQEFQNDVQSQLEAWNRLAVVNKIASVYSMSASMPGSVVNLRTGFNTKFGTNYSKEQLLSTYLPDFLKYMVSEIRKTSDYMTERSLNYHWSPAKTVDGTSYNLLRHTPYAKQRVMLYSPLFVDAETQVLPEIFNPSYLDIKTQYEGVTFWQAQSDRAAIHCTPAVTDTTTGEQKAGTEVTIPYVVGMIFDEDALLTDFQLEVSRTSPIEARKGYRTVWNSYARNIIADPTENTTIFILD